MSDMMKQVVPQEVIENKIFMIHGNKVMLSTRLAQLYGVETRVLMQAVKRNADTPATLFQPMNFYWSSSALSNEHLECLPNRLIFNRIHSTHNRKQK